MPGRTPDPARDLYREAVRLPPQARLDFLRQACQGDDALFARVAARLSDLGTTLAAPDAFASGREPFSPVDFGGTERFVIRRQMGQGSFGVVYEVLDTTTGTHLALKTLQNVTSESLFRFKREFRSLADVSHRNLAQLYELASHGEHWFFTMELVHGRPFLDYVWDGSTRPGELSSEHLDRLTAGLRQLVQGLDALHASGHLHRDVKPANVLVDVTDRVVLLDFGLIVDAGNDASQQTLLIAGTPVYMSPEQAAGLPLTPASDLYSVGVMLYEALTGTTPFAGTYLEILTAKQHADPEPASSRVAGVPPSLDRLCQGLLHRDAARRPTVDVLLDLLGGQPVDALRVTHVHPTKDLQPPFVGRGTQLARLHQALQRMLGGALTVATVYGPSGIGKSALVRAFIDSVRKRYPSAVVLSGRCYERESVPYKALDSLVDALARYLKRLPNSDIAAVLPREIGSVAQLFPLLREFHDRVPQRGPEPRDAQEVRRRAYAGLRELLARIGDRHPLVVFIDDLQWGDIDSAGLLAEIVRPPDAPVMLLVASYRDAEIETSPFLRSFLHDGLPMIDDVLTVRVDPLGATEARELASALLESTATLPGGVADVIAFESGGSPFFIDELVRFAETGPTSASPNRPASPNDSGAREATLAHMIRIRVSRLPRDAQRLLELVAVNGRPLPERVLLAARAMPAPEAALAVLRTAHFVRARETEHGAELEPYHDRIREIVVRSLDPQALRRCHQTLVHAFERLEGGDPELLAEHSAGAGEIDRAARYVFDAARLAEQALAFDRAARLYRRALAMLPHESADRSWCMESLARALSNAGRCAEAAAAYLDIPPSSPRQGLEFRQKAAQQFLFAGHIDEGLRVVREVLTAIDQSLPESRAQTLLALAAGRLRVRLGGLRYRERCTEEIDPDELMRVDACWSVAAGLGVVDTMRGAVFQTRHLALALRAGELSRVHRALCMEAVFVATGGSRTVERTQRIRQLTQDLTPRVGSPYAEAMQLLTDGASDYLLGRWRSAQEAISAAERIFEEQCTGVTWELDCARYFNLWALKELGDLRAIASRFPPLLKDAQDRGDLYASTTISVLLAHVTLLASGDPVGALRYTREAIQRWDQPGFHMPHLWELWLSVDIALYQSKGVEAHAVVERTWPALKQSLLLNVQFTRISMLNLRARATLGAAASMDGKDREPLFKHVLALAGKLERERATWADALALMLRAGVHQVQGDTAAALRSFTSTIEAFLSLDMQLAAAAARRRCGALLGGDEGRRMVAESDEYMAVQGVSDAVAATRMFVPVDPSR